MRIISTLFKHHVYSGLHELLKQAAGRLDAGFVICEDTAHKNLKVSNTNYITSFNYQAGGKPLKLGKEDVVVCRSLLNTSQPFRYLISNNRFLVCEEYDGGSVSKNRIYRFIARTFFRKALFLAQTPRTRDFLLDLGLDVVYCPTFMKPRFSAAKGKHILYVARMEAVKNPELVVELAKRLPDKRFIFVSNFGDPVLMEQIKAECAKLPNAEFLFRVQDAELADLYRDAEMLLLPTSADPIGYTVVEALSFSTPAITTVFAGSSGFTAKGWVLDSLDIAAWEKKIIEVAADKDARAKAKQAFLSAGLETDGNVFRQALEKVMAYLKS